MNYKKVIEDFNSGEIDKDRFQLVMDNDGGYWSYIHPGIDDYNATDLEEMMEEKYGSPEGYRDIVDVLNAAGVNCDWC